MNNVITIKKRLFHKLPLFFLLVDNLVYSTGTTSAKNGSSDFTASADYAEVDSRPAVKPLHQGDAHYEFEEHTYEYEEANFSNLGTMNEYAYAEVGPYEKVVSNY